MKPSMSNGDACRSNGHVINGAAVAAATTTQKHSQAALIHRSRSSNGKAANGTATNCYAQNGTGAGAQTKDSHANSSSVPQESYEQAPLMAACLTFIGYYLLMVIGFINHLFFTPNVATEKHRNGYAPLYSPQESLYTRYVYRRIRDCFNRPISSVPGAELVLKDRITRDYGWTFEYTGTQTKCLNLGSYNYLGFAQTDGPCADAVEQTIRQSGLVACSSRMELGSAPLHAELEALTAEFLQVDDAIVFGMGFATNALNIPSLIEPGCLVVSDAKNHASIILGLKLSGATTRVFQHNNMQDLERVLRTNIVRGRPETGAPWKKVLIVVEGVFSMEGSIVKLPEIVALKKRYKAYLYLDEAHSIGAAGPHGRGVCDYFGVDARDVDIMMGTFTKSFGSAGGYIAGTRSLVNALRATSHAHVYASSMAPPVAQQILTSMKIIMGKEGDGEGQRRIDRLARNTRYFRRRLAQMGVITFGHVDSPVVPMLVYLFSKIAAVIRELTLRNVAVVGVGYPATPLREGRIRFCLSAAHTILAVVDEIADRIGLKYSRKPRDPSPIEY